MSFQLRGADGRVYSHLRDVTYNLPWVLNTLMTRTGYGAFPQLKSVLSRYPTDAWFDGFALDQARKAALDAALDGVSGDRYAEVSEGVEAAFAPLLARRDALVKKTIPADIARGVEALTVFLTTKPAGKPETMQECLERSGFLALPDYAQVAVFAHLGALLAGVYFDGVRHATLGGVGPVDDLGHLLDAAREFKAYAFAPPWQRPFRRALARARAAASVLFSRKETP